jgi:hypothetical protein
MFPYKETQPMHVTEVNHYTKSGTYYIYNSLFLHLLPPPQQIRPCGLLTIPESIWKFESYRHLVGLLKQGISSSQGHYRHKKTQIQNYCRHASMSQVGSKPTIPVFKQADISCPRLHIYCGQLLYNIKLSMWKLSK